MENVIERKQTRKHMSRQEKLLTRMLSFPRDFTWNEMVRLLMMYGYTELRNGKTGGSRRKFADIYRNVIVLHKPHPENTIKEYVIKQVIAHLREKGHLKYE